MQIQVIFLAFTLLFGVDNHVTHATENVSSMIVKRGATLWNDLSGPIHPLLFTEPQQSQSLEIALPYQPPHQQFYVHHIPQAAAVPSSPYIHHPSTGEIAAAIQAAKEASVNVMAGQQRVQDAKDALLHQQHLSTKKQTEAALALQRTEAAAAVQQQESRAAATALVEAQKRLARTKTEVAELQRIASAKEALAAAVIQKSAVAAAAEIQRNDEVARKISGLQHAVTLKQSAVTKDGTLSAASAAVAAEGGSSGANGNNNKHQYGGGSGWLGGASKFIHLQPWT